MDLVTNPPRLAKGKHALVDAVRPRRFRRPALNTGVDVVRFNRGPCSRSNDPSLDGTSILFGPWTRLVFIR
jgi:hypothetical protein